MIPLKLELYNFLAYCGPESLDFAGLHVVCLSGENGAGKSALLDAITWALWGEARARSDDELIHHGRSEMWVTFTFQLGNHVYRVTRQRQAGKATRSGGKSPGRTLLDLQVEHNGAWRSLGEDNVRQTQAKITELLRLDYDTFIHSAFLMQGRADAFTIKPPAERKQVLADILGLEQWEEYDRRAKERLDKVKEELSRITYQLEDIDRELAQRGDIEKELEAAQADVVRLSAEREQADAAEREMDLIAQKLEGVERQQADQGARLQAAQRELERIQQQLEEARRQLKQHEDTIARREEIEQGYQRWLEARREDERLSTQAEVYHRLNRERERLKGAIQAEEARLKEHVRQLRARLAEEEKKAGEEGELLKHLEDARSQMEHLDAVQAQRDGLQADRAKLAEARADLAARSRALHEEIEPLKEKVKLLEQGADLGVAECPLCGQPLSQDKCMELIDRFRAEGKEKADRLRTNKAELDKVDKRVQELDSHIADLDRELKRRDAVHKWIATLEEQLKATQAAQEKATALKTDIEKLEAQLAFEDFAHEAREELAGIDRQLADLGYDPGAHQQVRRQHQQYQPFEAHKRELDLALVQLEGERRRVRELDDQCQRQEAAVEAEKKRISELQAEAEALKKRLAAAEQIRRRAAELRQAEHEARLRLDRAQQKLGALEYRARQREQLVGIQAKLEQDKAIYEELRLAFGKKGIPAMIIETAIPEIEKTANELLSRMTNGRMHVRFETQRDTTKGETVETLDIKISDELGTRDYHMYSGGEGFRVNFAIRVALSQLLARRAGAQLQTLVVDEGFGALDANGREQLIEAINAVSRDFARIIVVTHLDELKDAFPARIHVVKMAGGSRLAVS
jgi:exonuclease SbcC